MQLALQSVALPRGIPGSIEVHLLDIHQEAHRLPYALSLLSKDELDRHGRYRQPIDARRFTLTRAALRERLGAKLLREPAALRFDYGRYGKPSLVGEALRFNVSHSGQYALIALSTVHDIGIDIERRAETPPFEILDMPVFSIEERTHCANDPARFYALWCGKEAMIKACGTGFSIEGGLPTALPRGDGSYATQRPDMHAWSLPMPPHYAAALAILAD